MGNQTRIILSVIAALAVAGLAGLGLYYGLEKPAGPDVAGQQRSVQPQQPDAADGGQTPEATPTAPSFDLVRVEPTGEIVAAGSSAAGARVELLTGDDLLASADANAGGEWAMVTDKPLDPGSYELVLRANGEAGSGDMVEGDRVTVVIEAPDKTPLVAVTRPGQPTQVLQQPEETAAAAPAPTTPPATATEDPSAAEPQAGQAVAAPVGAEPQAQQDSTLQAQQDSAPDPGSQQLAAVTPPASQQQTAAPSPAAERPSAGQSSAVQPASDQPAETQPPATPAAQVAIETVEVEEPGRLMLSGRADAGAPVRLYLNNERLADIETGADGRWSTSSERPMPPGRYAVRADVVTPSGEVKGRAEVRFDRVQLVEETAQAPAAAGGSDATAADASGPGGSVTIVSRAGGSGAAESNAAMGAGAGTSVVVIARGDNLWRIARKIYGAGVRHSVIYEANRNQIRDPDLIYPGQVFTIPVFEDAGNPNG